MAAKLNSLSSTHPELAMEAVGWDPDTVTSGSGKRVNWKCPLGHIYLASIKHRTIAKSNCPYCAGQKVLAGFNDLATVDPVLASQAYGWDATTLTQFSGIKRNWKCLEGHVWQAGVGHRSRGNGCPICSGKRVLEGYNDFETLQPSLAKEAFGWDPKTVTQKSHAMKKWKCSKGHTYDAAVAGRTSGRGCPICSGKRVLEGFNDLASIAPEVASQAHGWNPKTIMASTSAKLSWICPEKHIWSATVKNRVRRQSGCPICSNAQVLVGYNDLKTTNPDTACEASGWDPTTVTSGSSRRKKWKCSRGHYWITTPASRVKQGQGCGVCAGVILLSGFNDLATTDPEIAATAYLWDPSTVIGGLNRKFKWRCEFGHVWSTTINTRKTGSGCPTCSIAGFDPNSEGWLYFLQHQSWGMLQIGITNVPDDRINRHRRLGWDLIELRGPMDGMIARKWERSILRMLKRHGAELGNIKIAGKFDGYTEAWVRDSFKAESLRELMDAVHDDE